MEIFYFKAGYFSFSSKYNYKQIIHPKLIFSNFRLIYKSLGEEMFYN